MQHESNLPQIDKSEAQHPKNPNEISREAIKADFEALPDNPMVTILKNDALKGIEGAKKKDAGWEDTLFFSGVNLGYARAYMGKLDGAVDLGKGVYVENTYGWDKRGFAEVAIPAYVEGFELAKQVVPEEVQGVIRSLYPHWFPSEFGVEYNEETARAVFQPKPALLPFDHYTAERKFIGQTAHYPNGYSRRVFGYMKAWAFPPVMWYSDRPENDFEGYVANKAKSEGLSLHEAVLETGTHEASHLLAINPAVIFAMKGGSHCWLTEGVAMYFGDRKTHKFRIRGAKDVETIADITDTEGKPVKYAESLLLTLGLAYKLSNGQSVEEGVTRIVRKVTDKAQAVIDGKEREIAGPTELLYFLDPSLQDKSQEQKLIHIMQEVKREVSEN